MGRVTFAVHDLVQVDPEALVDVLAAAPAWVAPSLRRAPWMVIRRDVACDALPVGIRGRTRAQRYAAHLSFNDVVALSAPETLCKRAARHDGPLGDASRLIARYAAASCLRWGPVGSFGFELASGRSTTTGRSDLDIILRASGVPRAALLAWQRVPSIVAAAFDVRLDVELDFEVGGVALAEYALPPARVLAKTQRGPELVTCP